MISDKSKKILFQLYPEYNIICGPYLRKDRRKHIVLSKGKYKRTLSWPKAIMEIMIGRKLIDNETVDHKDDNFTNDNFFNLQILTRRRKYFKKI